MFRRKHETTLRPESEFIPPSHVRVIPEVYDQEAESNVTPIRELVHPASEAIHYADVINIINRLDQETDGGETRRMTSKARDLARKAIEPFKPITYDQAEDEDDLAQ